MTHIIIISKDVCIMTPKTQTRSQSISKDDPEQRLIVNKSKKFSHSLCLICFFVYICSFVCIAILKNQDKESKDTINGSPLCIGKAEKSVIVTAVVKA